ncbi:MAG: hypothetical protein M3Y08_01275 [Fibrobacterota bacterium]|nr:hypothetical protein [Fibrobacterota bacterium]
MAQRTRKRQEQTIQTVLPVTKYLGMNTSGKHTSLVPGESRLLKDCDIYATKEGDYIKSRRGTQFLMKASLPTKRSAGSIYNAITWDVGAEEYLITQEGSAMYAQALIATGNPVAIALATGGAFTLGSVEQTELFISGDKLYVLHPSANYVIRWTGAVFVAYPMGFGKSWFTFCSPTGTGTMSGRYIYGVEKVYQVAGIDLMASTPNRFMQTRVMTDTGTMSLKSAVILDIKVDELDNDPLWTHIRLWRTKNLNADNTDILNPIDAQGHADELYEVALITRAEINGVQAAIATGSPLPVGNAGVTAGKAAGTPRITDNNADTKLFNMVGIDRIELLPIPACTTGCFCANRIFFSGVQDAALDDASKSNLWYSNYAGTKYAFQYSPLNFVDTGRDGQNMIKLFAFEKDVIGIKEAKTGRLPSGNVDIPFQTLDDKIGIAYKNMAAFIPTIGIAAIVNDNKDFRVFGYDMRWTNTLNGAEISLPVRTLTAAYDPTRVSFIYINGKILIWDGSNNGTGTLVLHVKEGRGWTQYFPQVNNAPNRAFTFAQGTRAAAVAGSTHLVEIEINDLNTDIHTGTDLAQSFSLVETTHCFQSNQGRDILELEYLSLIAYYESGQINTLPYVNTLNWPTPATPTTIYFARPPANIIGSDAALGDTEYRLYVEPKTVGTFKWCPMVGNFLHFNYQIAAPATVRGKELHATLDQNGMAWGAFDPFQVFPTTNTDPTWAQ